MRGVEHLKKEEIPPYPPRGEQASRQKESRRWRDNRLILCATRKYHTTAKFFPHSKPLCERKIPLLGKEEGRVRALRLVLGHGGRALG